MMVSAGCTHDPVGWVERSETHRWAETQHDGLRYAQPILRTGGLGQLSA